LIVIDTFARIMAGADENSARDVGVAVGNCDRLVNEFNCAVALIHHAGKDTAKGARGSSALRAAAETEILVEGDQDRRTATVTKQRDGEDNLTFAFRLEHVEIDGNLIATSCILEPLSDWKPSTAKAAPSRKLSDRQKNALTVLTGPTTLFADNQCEPGT
jgi:putative DNA primase/helicase